MTELTVDNMRILIRIAIQLRKFCQDIEKSIYLELVQGSGNLYVRMLRGLRDSALEAYQDPYLASLDVDISDGMSDREKAGQILVVAGQLMGYLESITGIVGLADASNEMRIQTAPSVIVNTSGSKKKEKQQALEIVRKALGQESVENEEND